VGFSQIITTVNNDIQAMAVSNESSKLELVWFQATKIIFQGTQPFSVLSDEQSILDAFTTVRNVPSKTLDNFPLIAYFLVCRSPPRAPKHLDRESRDSERPSVGRASCSTGTERS
jgi:hypothetical protein